MTGKIKLGITFSEKGYVSKISVIKKLGQGLTENAIRAARLIRFLPQENDNKPVTVTKIVEYSFAIY